MTQRILTGAAAIGLIVVASRLRRSRVLLLSVSSALLLRSLSGFYPGYGAAGPALESNNTIRRALAGPYGAHVESTITIGRPPHVVYAFWRDLTQLSRALPSNIHVEPLVNSDSRWWITKGGVTVARWTSRIVNDEDERVIAWKTLEGADVVNAGNVQFEAVPGGTRLSVKFQYSPLLGRTGAQIAELLGQGAESFVRRALDNVKEFLENEDVVTSVSAW